MGFEEKNFADYVWFTLPRFWACNDNLFALDQIRCEINLSYDLQVGSNLVTITPIFDPSFGLISVKQYPMLFIRREQSVLDEYVISPEPVHN